MITATSSNFASNSVGQATSPVAGANKLNESEDRFLKLLVAQINSQDPMNPMDNAQMTSQMAQINTVTGIQQVNETLKNMTTQFASFQVLQGASMVGREVITDSNKLSTYQGVAKGAIDLGGSTDSVKVDVLKANGQLLETINLGSLPAGRHNFSLDTSAYNESNDLSYKITATGGGKAISATALSIDRVNAISSEGGVMMLQLNGRSVAYSNVKAFL